MRFFLLDSRQRRLETPLPISREWYTSLLRRLDSVRTVYRVAKTVTAGDFDYSRKAPQLIWYRQGIWDAALLFQDRQVVPILVQGKQWGLLRFLERVQELKTYNAGHINGAFLVARDFYSLNRVPAKLREGGSVIQAYVCVEKDLKMAQYHRSVWFHPVFRHRTHDAEEILPTFKGRGMLLPPKAVKRVNLPWTQIPDDLLIWAKMSATAKTYLDMIARCHLIRTQTLQKIAGSERSNHYRLLKELRDFGLLEEIPIGDDKRITLSDKAIRLITYRDRLSYNEALKARSASLRDDGTFRGSLLRETFKNLKHDDNVYETIALFAQHAREEEMRFDFDAAWHIQRRYRDKRGPPRQFSPDALMTLYAAQHYFLEVEFRVHGTKRLQAKLRPYINYYANEQWSWDLRNEPFALFVFGDPATAYKFLRLSFDECRKAEVIIPIGVTDIQTLRRANSVSKEVWMTRRTLRGHKRTSLSQNRHFRG